MSQPNINEQLDELARRYDAGEFRGPGEHLAEVTRILNQTEICRTCGHVKDHEACNGRVE